jgi:hypothetical protein
MVKMLKKNCTSSTIYTLRKLCWVPITLPSLMVLAWTNYHTWQRIDFSCTPEWAALLCAYTDATVIYLAQVFLYCHVSCITMTWTLNSVFVLLFLPKGKCFIWNWTSTATVLYFFIWIMLGLPLVLFCIKACLSVPHTCLNYCMFIQGQGRVLKMKFVRKFMIKS